MECEEIQNQASETVSATTTSPAAGTPVDPRKYCGSERDYVGDSPDVTVVAVDECGPKYLEEDGSPAQRCLVREVLDLSGGSVIASAEAVYVVWPMFSRRLERGGVSFRDAKAGVVFRVRFDPRAAQGLRIFSAREMGPSQ